MSKKALCLLILALGSTVLFAQNNNSISLPFWDDFSTSQDMPDPNMWETGADIYINNTLPINAPSINVATFDGANALGAPHNTTPESQGAADSLISRPINLAAVSNRSSVFLTFYWQVKGNGEIPESLDSMRLQFFDRDSVWQTVWSITGGPEQVSDEFTFESIQITDARYFHNGFQMKFQSFSSLSGIFDTWHIDYVYLNENRMLINGTLTPRTLDRTISTGPGPLFGDYYQIPSTDTTITFSSSQVTTLNNLDNTVHPVDYQHTITNLARNEVIESRQFISTILRPNETRSVSGINSISLPVIQEGDSLVLQSEFFYKTGDRNLFEEIGTNGDTLFLDIDLTVNDTIRTNYLIHNKYAYDDGSAEFAAGINLDQGLIAVQFVSNARDTLSHIEVHFPAFPENEGLPLDLVVWRDLEEDGEITRQSYTITAPIGRNAFEEVPLFPPVIVEDTFYIGYQQFTDQYIGLGLDRSNDVGDKIFFNTDQTWQQNQLLEGALMIRPVFREVDAIVLSTKKPFEVTKVYPNPTSGIIHIEGAYQALSVSDLSGKVVAVFNQRNDIDLSHLKDGIYLLRIRQKDTILTRKLILQRNGY